MATVKFWCAQRATASATVGNLNSPPSPRQPEDNRAAKSSATGVGAVRSVGDGMGGARAAVTVVTMALSQRLSRDKRPLITCSCH